MTFLILCVCSYFHARRITWRNRPLFCIRQSRAFDAQAICHYSSCFALSLFDADFSKQWWLACASFPILIEKTCPSALT